MMSKDVDFILAKICALLSPGALDLINAAIAAELGAAAEVPQKGVKPGVVVVSQSAAAISGFCSNVPPTQENRTQPGVMAVVAGTGLRNSFLGPSEL